MLLAQLTARLGSLGGTKYAGDLCIASEVVDRWAHVGHAPLSRHCRRQGRSNDLELQPVPPVCAQCQGGHVGSSPAVGDLAARENVLVRGSPLRCSH